MYKLPALWVLVLWLTLSTVSAIFAVTGNTRVPVAYNDIEPDTTNCEGNSDGSSLKCSVGSVLSDGDIGPTHSVDVSDPDQVHRFFVWNRVNGTVALQFQRNSVFSRFNVSYIDIYTLNVPSARIGSPGTTSVSALEGTVSSLNTQSCSFSSTASTLSRTMFNGSLTNIKALFIRFEFTSQDIDWLFISEIQLCEGNAPSVVSCEPPPTSPPTQTPPPSPTTPPPITLTPLPSSVTPDLSQPDSVSLTCSVASPATDDYQYQWQWWKSRALLNNDTQFTITHTTNTRSSSLHISGIGYSDAGEYMCGVQYAMCPDGVDCSEATPNIQLNLPGTLIHVVHISTQPPSLSPWSVHCNSISLEVKGHTVCSRGD